MSVQGPSDVPGASLTPATVSWNCFTSAAAGSASDCAPRRLSTQDIRGAAVVPAGPTGLQRGVSGSTVTLRWVEGHAGHAENERCDVLAVAAAGEQDLPIDSGYEQPPVP